VRSVLASLVLVTALLAVRVASSTIERSAFPWPVALPDDRSAGGAVRFVSVPEGPWTLFVGGSSLYYGVDPERLPFPHHKQTVNRGLPTDLFALVDWDLQALPADRRPERVVVGFNPTSVVDRRRFDRQSPCATVHVTERVDAEAFAALGCNPEVDLAGRFERADRWYARRAMVVRAVGFRLGSLLGRPTGPGPDTRLERMRGSEPRAMEARLRGFAKNGLTAELPDPVQVRAVELLRDSAGAHGVAVVGVMLPEHAKKRALYPEDARLAYEALVTTNVDRVLDLRDALPDDTFYDEAHPNERGRAILTDLLADALRPGAR
jgi:hypothetical protein